MKPLFRWTVGPCLQQGLDILEESIKRTTEVLGIDNFDWAICYNGLTGDQIEFLKKAKGSRPIYMLAQDWSSCPVPDNVQTPRRKDGSFEMNGNRCGGTMWKVCPARLRMESHEIVMDNDIILRKKFPQIDDFLSSGSMTLMLEEPVRFYGRYDCLFPTNQPNLNSGLMGFPPKYDYGKAILKVWKEHGEYTQLSQADEQGLLTYTLSQMQGFRIQPSQMKEILHREFNSKIITGEEEGIHFTQANRGVNHRAWKFYKEHFIDE